MQAGKLRHRITIEGKTPGRDSVGQPLTTWTALASGIPASIEPLKGRELLAAQAQQSEISVRMRLRYLAGVTTAHRVIHNGVAYGIVEVINEGLRNIELQLLCTAGVSHD